MLSVIDPGAPAAISGYVVSSWQYMRRGRPGLPR